MNPAYSNPFVNCSMDQPLQNLMDKLSSKSSQLYIFWQNYNQLYNLYQEKSTQIVRLRQQIVTLRRQNQVPKVQMVDDSFLKERYLNLQKNFNDLKLQNQRLKNQNKDLRKQTSRYYEQNLQLQTLLQQLREENTIQRQSIQKILNQLRNAQQQLSTYSKLYEQVQQKQHQIAALLDNQRKLNQVVHQMQDQIEEIQESKRQMEIHYENLLRETMENAKTKVKESLPHLMKTSTQKVQVFAS